MMENMSWYKRKVQRDGCLAPRVKANMVMTLTVPKFDKMWCGGPPPVKAPMLVFSGEYEAVRVSTLAGKTSSFEGTSIGELGMFPLAVRQKSCLC